MTRIVVCLLLLFAADSGFGREVTISSYRFLYADAELVVIAKPHGTKFTTEKTKLEGVEVLGVSTEFEVVVLMKGETALKYFVLHHYAEKENRLADGLNLVWFPYDPKEPRSSPSYLLFLRKEADGRYAPVNTQADPALSSVVKLPAHGD